jgi:predicted CoA-binding protein
MSTLPVDIAEFLSSRRVAVAGVSRTGASAGNPVIRKLRTCGYETFPVNPHATELEGARAYPTIRSIGVPIDGVVIATHPSAAIDVVRDAADAGVRRIWFHRSFGQGSVSQAAVDACHARNLTCIVGGCPLMFCEPVDLGHRCMRWWLQRSGRVPR